MNATAAVDSKPRPSRGSRAWNASLILIPALTALALFWIRQAQVKHLASRAIPAYGSVPHFALTNQDGQSFGSAQLAGKIWIADFIFTTCPGPCPMISTRMSELQRPLEKSDVHLVSVTVDPEKDTPAVLREYSERLHAQPGRWDFLTGAREEIYDLSRNGFKLGIADGAGENGTPVHSTRMILVDRRGTIRGYYDGLEPDTVTKLLADTSHLLREQPR